MDNVHKILVPHQDSSYEDNEYSETIKTMYEQDPILKHFNHVNHRRSIVDLTTADVDEPEFEIRGNVLSRRNSAVPSVASHHNLMTSSMHSTMSDLETLDHVANAASHHNTLYSYHFMDETDKTVILNRNFKVQLYFNPGFLFVMIFQMKFSKILDMTDTESITSQTEHDANQKLEFDDSEMLMDEETEKDIFQHDVEVLLPESKEMMGDWTCSGIRVDEINSDELDDESRLETSPSGSSTSIESMDSFYKPEADQKEHDQLLSDNVVAALHRDTKDFATISHSIDE